MKFSIVSPSYNTENWIAETIESLLSQEGDFEIEYILQDGGSTDNTVKIFEEYRARLESGTWPVKCKGITMQSYSEKDKGTFDAINKGFARATGDIYTWLDADNDYVPGALQGIANIFKTFPDIEWVKGYSSTMSEEGEVLYTKLSYLYRQDWLEHGVYGLESYHVNADTVFWTAELWKKAGPLPSDYRCAGEQQLWNRMAKYTPLWAAKLYISKYRKRAGSLSKNIARCKEEKWRARDNKRSFKAWQARLFFAPQSRLYPRGEKFFVWLYPLLFMRGNKKMQYIDFENGRPVKRKAKSFIIGEHPTYADITPR
ncbi:MAG TPA: glycosyltransferase [Candidatus Paceibacterota bacterium]|nr:glycosyltransferase [Candidatus Paceibacterota bacterium]